MFQIPSEETQEKGSQLALPFLLAGFTMVIDKGFEAFAADDVVGEDAISQVGVGWKRVILSGWKTSSLTKVKRRWRR